MLIHKMRLDEYMAVLDVNSGAVHLVDDVIYDLLDVFDGTNDDEAIAALQTSYPEKDLREAFISYRKKDYFFLLNLKCPRLLQKHQY